MADETGGDVVIRLSQEGGEEVVQRLQEIIKKLGEVGEASEETAKHGEKAGGALDKIASATGLTAIAEFGEKVFAAGERVKQFAEEMIEAKSEEEQMLIQLTSLNEKVLGFSQATEQAEVVLSRLKGLAVTGSDEELVNLFKRMTTMVGGTDDALINLTERMKLFGQANGVAAEQLLRVIQMAERTGSLPMRGQMAYASQKLQEAGITGEDVKAAAIAGTLDQLLQKLQVSDEMTQRLTMSWETLQARWGRATNDIKEIIGGAFEPLKTSMKELTEALGSEESAQGFTRLADAVKYLVTQVRDLFQPGTAQEGVSYWQKTLTGIVAFFSEAIIIFKTLLDTWTNIIVSIWEVLTHPTKFLDPDEGVREAKRLINEQIEIIKGAGEKMKEAWDNAFGDKDTGPSRHLTPEEDDAEQAALAKGHKGVGPDFQNQIKQAKEALDELFKTTGQKYEMAGLDGLDKKLKEIANSSQQELDALDKAEKRIREMGGSVDADKDAAARLQIRNAKMFEEDKARADEQAKLMKEAQAAEEKYQHAREELERNTDRAIDQMRKSTITDAIDQIDAATDAQVDAMRDRVEKLKEQQDKQFVELTDGYQADLTAWMEVEGKKRELDEEFAAYEEDAWAKAEQKKAELRHRELGDWGAYYNDLMLKSKDAHENMFVATQENSRKVAAEMEKAAVTSADGWAAGLAKIRTSITSFGQDLAGVMDSVWGSLTKSFETGFYDILSGKFESLKDVFKSLWDDILKSFAKMLAQMLERWILTGEAMGSGQGKGGIMGAVQSFLSGGGNIPTETPGGTGAISPGGGGNEFVQGASGYQSGGPVGSGGPGVGGYMAAAGALYGIGSGIVTGINALNAPRVTSNPTYNGTDLGQTADFGHESQTGALVTGAATAAVGAILATTAAASAAITAVAGAGVAAVVPVVGWVVAAVLLVVAAALAIFSGPQEGHIYAQIEDQFDQSGAKTAISSYVDQIIGATTDYVGGLAARAGMDTNKYTAAYTAAFQKAYGQAKFDLHAGSPEDLQKDVNYFFQTMLPTLAMKAAFGQTGYGFGGNSDVAGGVAGISWNTNNGLMNADGSWVKKQLYDPEAPIPMMLTGLGVTGDRIGEIAQKLANGEDIKAFQKFLMDFVGVVYDLGQLSEKFGQTTTQWFDTIRKQQREQGTAAQFTTQITNLKNQGAGLENMTLADQVEAAKGLVTSSQTLMQNMAGALQSILNMIDSIKQATADTVQSYKDKLLTPAERETQARGRIEDDFKAITDAANPKEVQAAWQKTMKDLSTALDAIVARINAIKSLQQSYADFRTQMGKDAGPQFATDPTAWLAKNQADIDAVTTTLKTATGDDAIKGAQELLRLTQERYQNELAMLGRVNAAITSISEIGKTTSDNLKMQAMGHVETDPKTGAKKWVADTHAQGDYLKGQYDDLMKQLGSAKTPEEVQRIYGKLQGIISQLAAQPQDPEHYAESRQILSGMNDKATQAATDLLKKWGKTLEDDLGGTGDKLKAGETALAGALDAAEKDFTKYLGLMDEAASHATDALTDFADGISNAMRDLQKSIDHWTFTLTHGSDEKDPNWDYEKNQPKSGGAGGTGGDKDVWETDPNDENFEVCTAGPHKGNRRRKAGTSPHGPDRQPNAATTTTGGGVEADLEAYKKAMVAAASPAVSVTVNSGSPEEVAKAAADAAYEQTLEAIKANNVELVRVIRNNPTLITAR